MPEWASIYVKGSLNINGTENNPVYILPDKKRGVSNWGTIYFDHSNAQNILNHVIIESASNGADMLTQKAAISCNNSDVLIDNIKITKVDFPIFAAGGNTILRNSIISATGTCDYIGIKGGKALVENNLLFGNKSPDTDGIDFDGDTSCIIRNNKIYNFKGFNCDAIDIGEECRDILVSGNIIYNCTDKGVSVGQLSEAKIEKNVIVNCDMGVAVKDEAIAYVTNNTFFRNNYSVSCYEKNFGEGGGHAIVKNSILSASKKASIFCDSLSSIAVSYSLSDMENLSGNNNFFGNPDFTDYKNYNLELKVASKCLNTGDPALPYDPDNTQSDIGAYYIFSPHDIPDSLREKKSGSIVINEIMYNDGGSPDSRDWIELYNSSDEIKDISNWKITDEDSTHIYIIPSGINLIPKGFLVICKDTIKFKTSFPGSYNYVGNFEFGLDGNDCVNIYNNSGQLVNFISYHNNSPWPTEADGTGRSLELISPDGINYLTTNWEVSKDVCTPGGQNSVYTSASYTEINTTPAEYKLYQNYPNPFNPGTTINYSIVQDGIVELKIFDILGSEVATLVNEEKKAGTYKIYFNANNIASGIYFYRMNAGNFNQTRKLILLR